MTSPPSFGKIRNWIFPIYRNELRLFLPLCLINFCYTYGYSSLRVLKDAYVIGEGGAEAVYYLKAYGVTPAIIFFTIVYNIISKFLNKDGLFNFVIIYLLLFIIVFRIFLYPNAKFLQLEYFYNTMADKVPHLIGMWSIIKNWHTSLFYIHTELWGSYVLGISFWTLANNVITLRQSKRFYGLFPLAGNMGSFFAGFFAVYIFQGKTDGILISVITLGALAAIFYNAFFKRVVILNSEYKKDGTSNKNKKIDIEVENDSKTSKSIKIKLKKKKISFKESIYFLSKSQYLIYIALIVLSYYMSISFLESSIKDRWAQFAMGDESIISKLCGTQIMLQGILSTVFAFFATYLQRKNWLYAAIFTPLVFLISSMLFFLFLFSSNSSFIAGFGIDTLFLSVILGWISLIVIKASKYSFFEPTKEATYIPLDEKYKIRGKAAVDGVGSRLGKGMSSIILTLFILPLGHGHIKNVRHIIFFHIIGIIVLWFWSVKKLGVKFNTLTKKLLKNTHSK